jgi:hypothetical protein
MTYWSKEGKTSLGECICIKYRKLEVFKNILGINLMLVVIRERENMAWNLLQINAK